MDARETAGTGETPDADAAEQRAIVAGEDAGLDISYLTGIGDREANEADVIDQAIVVPIPDEEGEFPR
ncbi:hypothetical protein MSM1_12355 [Mycobacterium sp. SM1]|uniref:hypothetical protein n=1 Tax=Mycobacterium sp. SM1 TaxID=2816243 RepID=UPI001BCEDFC6|nr:hypothetical protein [Mycobacterium sp. SM1]MBS4729095.1 hypothetical protein [Mycobacterium sp. SM1]